MEHEILKQDSKINLFIDNLMDMKMEFTLRGHQYRHPARQIRSNKYENGKEKQTILIYLLVHQLVMISLNQIITIELMKSQ